jgi:hypothetical protein
MPLQKSVPLMFSFVPSLLDKLRIAIARTLIQLAILSMPYNRNFISPHAKVSFGLKWIKQIYERTWP